MQVGEEIDLVSAIVKSLATPDLVRVSLVNMLWKNATEMARWQRWLPQSRANAKREILTRKQNTCDGCQRKIIRDVELIDCCLDCDYVACDDCQSHACTSDLCMEKNGKVHPQVGPCRCGSCLNEMKRRRNPTQEVMWYSWAFPPLGQGKGDPSFHHNLARGTCFCLHSNFGSAYMHLFPTKCYHGAKGGDSYQGVLKSQEQLDMEDALLLNADYNPSKRCFNPKCKNPGTSSCAKCKSAWYCSRDCQKANWKQHKRRCAPFLPPAKWPYIELRVRQFKHRHGYYPGEKPTAMLTTPRNLPRTENTEDDEDRGCLHYDRQVTYM